VKIDAPEFASVWGLHGPEFTPTRRDVVRVLRARIHGMRYAYEVTARAPVPIALHQHDAMRQIVPKADGERRDVSTVVVGTDTSAQHHGQRNRNRNQRHTPHENSLPDPDA
jgi:hypothetical protein